MELQNIRRTECNHPVENGSHDRGDWPGFLPMLTRSYKIQNDMIKHYKDVFEKIENRKCRITK